MLRDRRATTSVVATVLVVAIAVFLSSVTATYVLGIAQQSTPSPQISVSHDLVEDGSERTVAVTLEAGDAVRTDRLYVVGSKDVDIGGSPSSSTPAYDGYASERENFVEASGSNPPQVGIGRTWEAGETVYLDPVGDATGTTIRIYWNPQTVESVNPGEVRGEVAYEIAVFTV